MEYANRQVSGTGVHTWVKMYANLRRFNKTQARTRLRKHLMHLSWVKIYLLLSLEKMKLLRSTTGLTSIWVELTKSEL